VAIAHLHHENVLLKQNTPQAGRPFVVTDPNPPIAYSDLYLAIKTLSVHSLLIVVIPPIVLLLVSHVIEWYSLLPYRVPFLRKILPELKGDVTYLKPGLFSITTHIVGFNTESSKPVEEGGLGYEGVLTTLDGMVLEVLEWNREHANPESGIKRKAYTTSISAAEKIRELAALAQRKVGG
jgi:hypothetical protein